MVYCVLNHKRQKYLVCALVWLKIIDNKGFTWSFRGRLDTKRKFVHISTPDVYTYYTSSLAFLLFSVFYVRTYRKEEWRSLLCVLFCVCTCMCRIFVMSCGILL